MARCVGRPGAEPPALPDGTEDRPPEFVHLPADVPVRGQCRPNLGAEPPGDVPQLPCPTGPVPCNTADNARSRAGAAEGGRLRHRGHRSPKTACPSTRATPTNCSSQSAPHRQHKTVRRCVWVSTSALSTSIIASGANGEESPATGRTPCRGSRLGSDTKFRLSHHDLSSVGTLPDTESADRAGPSFVVATA